jgi:hypothetical protein
MRISAKHTTHKLSLRAGVLGLAVLATAVVARPAFAGPPLLCHAFDIASAKSLPWSGVNAWYEGQAGYDLQRLANDTEAILTPSTPVLVRMETLRRAAIYASRNPEVARQLFLTVNDRIRTQAGGKPDALAMFDAGYLTETFRAIGRLDVSNDRSLHMDVDAVNALVRNVDGYGLVEKSQALRPNDASIELASALIAASSPNRKAQYTQHADKARAGAKQDALLQKNLTHISN